MDTHMLWSRILNIVGGIAMLLGTLDPMEGSLLILPGSGDARATEGQAGRGEGALTKRARSACVSRNEPRSVLCRAARDEQRLWVTIL